MLKYKNLRDAKKILRVIIPKLNAQKNKMADALILNLKTAVGRPKLKDYNAMVSYFKKMEFSPIG